MKTKISILLLCLCVDAHAQKLFSLLPPPVSVPQVTGYTNRGSIRLMWDASPDATVVSYSVRYGQNVTSLNNSAGVGNVTNATIKGLSEGVTYYFQVVALNAAGTESLPSNTVTNYFYSTLEMTPYAYITRTSVRPGSTNLVQESGDGVTFTNSQTIVVGTNGMLSFLRTNLGGNRFVRVMTK